MGESEYLFGYTYTQAVVRLSIFIIVIMIIACLSVNDKALRWMMLKQGGFTVLIAVVTLWARKRADNKKDEH
jgi:uncharacterized membrane protein